MHLHRQASSICRTAIVVAAVTTIAGCGLMDRQSNLVAFTTQLRGANEVPPNASRATGWVDAVLNKDTNLFR